MANAASVLRHSDKSVCLCQKLVFKQNDHCLQNQSMPNKNIDRFRVKHGMTKNINYFRNFLCHSEQSEESISKALLSNKDSSVTSFPQNDVKRAAYTLAEVFSSHPTCQRKCASQFIRDFAGVTSRSTRRAGFAQAHTAPYLKIGFTLAEVLITLGIIGVVAALTTPALVYNYRNKQLESGLKKGYSVLSQALNMYQAENGYLLKPEDVTWIPGLKPFITQYLQPVVDCGRGYDGDDGGTGCIVNSDDSSKVSKVYKTYNGKAVMNLDMFDDGQFIMNDGSFVMINGNYLISIDVNGYKKLPNRLGQDVFMFQLSGTGKFLPMGAEGTNYYTENDDYCSLTSADSLNGAGCTYKALSENNYFKKLPR